MHRPALAAAMKDEMLYRLTYVSTSAVGLSNGDLDDISVAAERNNARDAITGLLIYNGTNFMQTVEGPRAPVLALLEKLKQDRRHAGLITILDGPAGDRAFPNFALAVSRMALPGHTGPVADFDPSAFEPLPGELRHIYQSFKSLR